MKVKIFSFITALSIGFSSLIFPFYSVSAFAQQAVIPWPYIFRFIGESLGAWAISKGAEHAVDQLTGSGRKMTDDEYNATSKDWDACVSYMKSHGCTDSDIENLQAQIEGGDLDLSSKVGQAMQNYFAQKGANIDGSWNNFNTPNFKPFTLNGGSAQYASYVESIFRKYYDGFGSYTNSNIEDIRDWANANPNCSGILVRKWIGDDGKTKYLVFYQLTNYKDFKFTDGYYTNVCYCLCYPDHWASVDFYNLKFTFKATDEFLCPPELSPDEVLDGQKFVNGNTINNTGNMPSRISAYGGSIPHYYDNTIDNDDSSKNTYNNTPATIDWSKIFDSDDDKNPTFKKIDGYTPPKPIIKDDGSNYDEVIKQLKEANSKLAKILGWLQDFDYDNNGKIKDHRLSPIEPNTPLFNFKLSEKFPFSLPWDMLAILSILKADPVAPKYEFPIMMPDEKGKVKPIKLSDDRIGVIQGDKIVLDFTSKDWQDTAMILRWGELVLFICGLCVVFWKYGE